MSKMIRLSDETYELLKQYANQESRSITNAGNLLLEKYLLDWQDRRKEVVPPIMIKKGKFASDELTPAV